MTRSLTIVLLSLAAALPATALTVRSERAPRAAIIHASARIDAPLSTVLAALQQVCAVRQWLPNVQELRVIDRPSARRTRVYMRQNLPWPWRSRDVVSEFKRSGDASDNRVNIDQRNIDGVVSPKPDVVRMRWLRAHWTLQREGEATDVRYTQQLAMGGHIPQMLTDRAAKSLVRNSLNALKSYVENGPHADCGTPPPAPAND